MLSFHLEPRLLERLRQLEDKLVEAFTDLEQMPSELKSDIHRHVRISIIGASTRIENAVLTDAEIEWVDTLLDSDGRPSSFQENKEIILDKLNKDRERSVEEVVGCRSILSMIYDDPMYFFPLTETGIRALHHELMKYYSKAGPHIGRYKVQSNSVVQTNQVTKEKIVIFKTADAGPITETAMKDLVEWYNKARESEYLNVAVIAELVYRFLAIHPFQDGNGRMGRALFLLGLLQSPNKLIREVAPYLAIDREIEKNKIDYYGVLNRCSDGIFQMDPKKYHIEFFIRFMCKMIEAAVDSIKIYQDKCEKLQKLSETAKKILQCFKDQPELRLGTKDVVAQTKIPERTVIMNLRKLYELKFLQVSGQGSATRYQLVF